MPSTDQEPEITPEAALKNVMDMIIPEANQLQKDKGQADTNTRSLSAHLQSQPEGIQQCIAAQTTPDPCRSVDKLHEFLPDCEKHPGSSQHFQISQWMASIDGREKHDAFNRRIDKNSPPPPKKVPKTAQVVSRRNYNVKK
ncbi:hypothetical protein O181_101938 [Austropuccinia psidii MF-1]|uniref:Uncharacterized protein n=1 Tax=Austropuccinia psidii MF-1 TaxID=1389203 RepID=A0A9Q3JFF3_9BASI|nr:hypothetical protein [Austropuccinia psidii MF-1]